MDDMNKAIIEVMYRFAEYFNMVRKNLGYPSPGLTKNSGCKEVRSENCFNNVKKSIFSP